MTIEQIDPAEAYRRMQGGAVYLDVRSVVEFERGHATGAMNVPILHADPAGGMAPNPDFVAVCLANVTLETLLVVGCAVGGRSQRACELLAARGYANLANVHGGFSGARDPMGGLVAAGWIDLGLPVATVAPAGSDYAALARNAGV
jgi:rhodanese-related sulfurtransferase